MTDAIIDTGKNKRRNENDRRYNRHCENKRRYDL